VRKALFNHQIKYTLMGNNISRRTLLRNGAFLAGAIPFAGSLLNKVQAAPIASGSLTGHAASAFSTEGWTEREIGLSAWSR
jgi:hypothetical protein